MKNKFFVFFKKAFRYFLRVLRFVFNGARSAVHKIIELFG